MDPLDIMLNLDVVNPYYQPIISADTQLVTGYETKAFYQNDKGERKRLDWFFDDQNIPLEFQLDLTSWIHEKAIINYMELPSQSLLFLNHHPRLLFKDNGETLIQLLHAYQPKGLNLDRIVIGIKEELISEEMESTLRTLFKYLQTLGIKIALDVGTRNGNFNLMTLLEPDIVKLNVNFLKEDDLPHLYRDVHHSISMLARKIGASLLFKGITTYNQLNYAWRNGGRYYQGGYLQHPETDFAPADCCKEKIERDFQLFVNYEKKKIKAQLALTNQISERFGIALDTISADDQYDEIVYKVGTSCSEYAFRIYICNDEGLQLSSNAEKDEEGMWVLLQEGRRKNWSWRPYFFENIARMNLEKKGILSDLYTDIDRNEQIRTFSYPLSDTLYIFIDIPYTYLFEQEGLL